jgi:hypothetical protein
MGTTFGGDDSDADGRLVASAILEDSSLDATVIWKDV